MANSDAAFGFRPVNRDGSPYNGATTKVAIPAADTTATFIGDAVFHSGTSADGIPQVSQAAAGEDVYGVIVGFDVDPTNLSAQYRLASTLRYAKVATANDTYFEAQDDGTLAAASAGLNANFIVGSGNTTYGTSGMEIDSTTEATTNTLDLMLIAPVEREDNDGTIANAKWIVKFNQSQTRQGRTGV